MPRMAVSRLIGQYTLNTMLIIMKLRRSVNGGNNLQPLVKLQHVTQITKRNMDGWMQPRKWN
jgi:hypothetical protein